MSAVASSDGIATPSNRQIAAAVLASCLGWSLDLYDLFLLLFVAPVVGKLFFPTAVPTLSLAAVYASFAVTLLMRPVGSALFGSYADRRGRKRAMMVAVVGVGITTALFGALPTIAAIGVAAPILFLLLRLVQGIFVGGVVASTHTIGTESVPERWRGLLSGLIGGGGAGIGALLASIALAIISAIFPGPEFAVWGWRCLFFTALISAVLGLFVFRALEESPLWQRTAPAAKVETPVGTLFRAPHRRVLLINLLLTAGGGTGYYLTSGFMPSFLKLVSRLDSGQTARLLILVSLVTILASLISGALSQWIGRKATFLLWGVLDLIGLPVLYLRLGATHDLGTITVLALAITFLGNTAYSPLLIFLNERFPTSLRATGTGLSWNIGFAIGGTMPFLVSLTSGSVAGLPVALAIFCGVLFFLYLIGALLVPETRGQMT